MPSQFMTFCQGHHTHWNWNWFWRPKWHSPDLPRIIAMEFLRRFESEPLFLKHLRVFASRNISVYTVLHIFGVILRHFCVGVKLCPVIIMMNISRVKARQSRFDNCGMKFKLLSIFILKIIKIHQKFHLPSFQFNINFFLF